MKTIKTLGTGLGIILLMLMGIGVIVSPFILIANQFGELAAASTLVTIVLLGLSYVIGLDFQNHQARTVKVRSRK